MDVLDIPSVLESIFRHLPNTTVGICRLVCKTWNLEACKSLRERVFVTFSTPEEIQKFVDVFESSIVGVSIVLERFFFPSDLFTAAVEDVAFGNVRRLHESLRRFVFIAGDQVTTLKVCVIPILPVPSNKASPFTDIMFTEMLEMVYNYFLQVKRLQVLFIEPTIEPLQSTLEDRQQLYSLEVKDMMQTSGETILSHLKSIQIEMSISSRSYNDDNSFREIQSEMISDFISSLVQSAPNLVEISLDSHGSNSLYERTLFDNLRLASQSHLQCIGGLLSMSPTICTLNLPNLSKIQLEISAFEMEKDLEHDLPKEFCKRFGATLRIFALSFSENGHGQVPHFQFPVGYAMKRLQLFSLERYEGFINFHKLPALKNLTLKQCRIKNIVASLKAVLICRLNRLEIIDGMLDTREEFLECFDTLAIQCFPYLETLVLQNCRVVLSLDKIFKDCIQLRNLNVQRCGGITDETLCGIRKKLLPIVCPVVISGQDSNTISEQLNCLVTYAKSEGIVALREGPFIGSLSGLHTLTLEGDFSDVGVVYGISLCDKLARINLKSTLCTWISPSILKKTLNRLVSGRINDKRI